MKKQKHEYAVPIGCICGHSSTKYSDKLPIYDGKKPREQRL